jgi:hypothetical protein
MARAMAKRRSDVLTRRYPVALSSQPPAKQAFRASYFKQVSSWRMSEYVVGCCPKHENQFQAFELPSKGMSVSQQNKVLPVSTIGEGDAGTAVKEMVSRAGCIKFGPFDVASQVFTFHHFPQFLYQAPLRDIAPLETDLLSRSSLRYSLPMLIDQLTKAKDLLQNLPHLRSCKPQAPPPGAHSNLPLTPPPPSILLFLHFPHGPRSIPPPTPHN